MAVTVKEGFLYFLRDRDYRTGTISPYVKIGLTNADRPVSNRVDEHQTGNPRQVFSAHEFQVNAVDTAETHLHHLWHHIGSMANGFLWMTHKFKPRYNKPKTSTI